MNNLYVAIVYFFTISYNLFVTIITLPTENLQLTRDVILVKYKFFIKIPLIKLEIIITVTCNRYCKQQVLQAINLLELIK